MPPPSRRFAAIHLPHAKCAGEDCAGTKTFVITRCRAFLRGIRVTHFPWRQKLDYPDALCRAPGDDE
jgi:hypothetical protein